MKAFVLTLCVAGILAIAGCSDNNDAGTLINGGNGNGDNGNGGGGDGNAGNLQTFVVNNCNAVADGDAMRIDGQQFPADDANADPTQSIYTANCLGSQN
ncbi:hypothetical protein [Salinisphaera aquimarina]|uniref:Lipoprotein n=1 Tax=Salinisphaera aquimarina TaxID=2094031 RepID=A0ABV7ENU0_9GAMM